MSAATVGAFDIEPGAAAGGDCVAVAAGAAAADGEAEAAAAGLADAVDGFLDF